MNLAIQSYSVIRNQQLWVDGKSELKSDTNNDFGAFSKEVYKHLELSYPKFYKMDRLCKLAMLGAEPVLKQLKEGDKTGIVFCNQSSSILSDTKHQESIQNDDSFFPSPAVFVYTLSNIMLGEIAIKHKIKGENACFIQNEFDADLLVLYVENLMRKNKISQCLCGWVNYNENGYESFQVLVGSSAGNITFDASTIQKLFNSNN